MYIVHPGIIKKYVYSVLALSGSKAVLLLWIICVFLCLVFAMLLRLFIAALWSPEGKGLTSWLLFVMFIVILLHSHLVSWDRCGT